MIRIEEIYFNIFKSYIDKHIPQTRVFFCDPPGTTSPDNLMNYGNDTTELNYVFLHDQEPIFLDVHEPLFDDVVQRNHDIQNENLKNHKAIIHSEKNSEFVSELNRLYGWSDYYYFFHGWAALDWFRGYNHSYVLNKPTERKIKSSYISPNRIIAGKRDHRVLLFYKLLKEGINSAKISMPAICPYGNESILSIAKKFKHTYPDILDTLDSAALPWNFNNEQGHPMESFRLGLFNECNETLAYIVTETVFNGKRNHLTEKVFKPICMQVPFILISSAHSLSYLRSYGFKTFSDFWDESYDEEENDELRLEKAAKVATELDLLSPRQLNNMYNSMIPVLKHNYEHFYNGGFQSILWNELTTMLNNMKTDFNNK